MTPEEFLREFGALAETPDAPSRLRGVVYGLAATGALSGTSAPPSAQLRSLGTFHGGSTPSKLRAEYWSGDIPWVSPKDMKQDRLAATEDHVSEGAVSAGRLKLIPRGSILMVVRSGILRRMFPVAIADVPCTINQDMKALVLDPLGSTLPEYVQIALRGLGPLILSRFVKSGTTVESMKWDELLTLPLPLPPLPEQKRIVEKVDQLMALCDDLEAAQQKRRETSFATNKAVLSAVTSASGTKELKESWKRVQDNFEVLYDAPENVQELRQTILQLAVMGKLVRQDPRDEPAEKLLNRVAPHIMGFAEPTLPGSWRVVRLDSAVTLKSGTTISPEREVAEGKVMYIKVGDMNLPGNEREINVSRRFVNPDKKLTNALIPARSIIFPKRGGAIATNKKRLVTTPILADLNTMALVCPDWLELGYLYLWFQQIDLWALNNGTSVPQINNKDVGPLELPLPPAAEQRRIVEKLDQLMDLCDDLDARLQKSRTDGEALMKAVVEHLVAAPGTSSEPMAMVG